MALQPAELTAEAVVQLAQLAQSPGWGLYKARLRSLSKSRDAGKAEALRSNQVPDALLAQGYVDGLQVALEELERYISRLKQGEAHLPGAGSGS